MKLKYWHFEVALFFFGPMIVYMLVFITGGEPKSEWVAVSFLYVLIRLAVDLSAEKIRHLIQARKEKID